jgi:putative hemolysin
MLYIELAIVIVLILVNGLLALAELATVSSRRARLQALVDREVIGSRRALALAGNPGRFLSTVQVGITLVGGPGSRSGQPSFSPIERRWR